MQLAITVPGTFTIMPDGKVSIVGFTFDGERTHPRRDGYDDAIALALQWAANAIAQRQREHRQRAGANQ